LHFASNAMLSPASTYLMNPNDLVKQVNAQNDELLLNRFNIQRFWASSWSTYAQYGVFQALKGFIPFVFNANHDTPTPLGGSSEDTVEAMWAGKHETFRMFQVGPSATACWVIVGPEIA
jgi:hypothetical protein